MAQVTSQPENMPADFIKLFKSVIFEGKRVLTKVVHEVCACASQASSDEIGTQAEEFSNDPDSLKKKEKQFQSPLIANVMDTDLDIYVAYRRLTETFPEVFKKLGKDCLEEIQYLKHMRYKLSHLLNQDSIDIDIESEISKLEDVYRKIYQDVGRVLGLNLSQNIESTEQFLKEILEAKDMKDCDAYKKQLEEFKKSFTHQLFCEIHGHYKGLRLVNPCTWMETEREFDNYSVSKYFIDKIYTPQRIEGCHRGKEYVIDTKVLLTTTKEVRKNIEVLPTALLLYGLAGSGKTSLCRYILHDWRNSKGIISGLKELDLVILAEVRNMHQNTLQEFLIEQLLSNKYQDMISNSEIPFKSTANDEHELILTLRDMRILFIIDGYDEFKDEENKVIEEIFREVAKSPDRHRIIVTTRKEDREEVCNHLSCFDVEYFVLKVCGFDDDRIQEFTVKVFNEALQDEYVAQHGVAQQPEWYAKQCSDKFLKYINDRGRVLGEHLKLPLTLAFLIYLWIDNKDVLNNVTNCTTLYFELFQLCKKKMQKRLDEKYKKKFEGKCKSNKVIDELLLFIGKIAWKLLRTGQNDITSHERKLIEKECEMKGVNKKEMMSAFLDCEYDENQDSKEQYNYYFLHKTQMEYLAAMFMADHVKRDKLEIVTAGVERWSRYHQVIMFFIGHLAISSVEDLNRSIESVFQLVEKADIREGNYDFWWRFLVEAKKNQKVAKIIATEILPKNSWVLNSTDHIVPGLELLGSIPTKLESLKIDVDNNVDPYNIKNLLEVMGELRDQLCHHYNKDNPLLTELHFWRHNEYSCVRPTDDLVRTLRPWGHLTNLTGSLGEQEKGKELLNYCRKLKTLRVRLCSVKAVMCLKISLDKIHRSIRNLRVTLAMPPGSVEPTSFPILTSMGSMEVTIPGAQDKDKEWVMETVKSVAKGQGCKNLFMDNSELSCDAVLYLLDHLKRVVLNKLTVKTVCDITDEERILVKAKENDTNIEVDWIF